MENVLWISVIGMGLVFVAILLLWGLMALLVKLTAAPEEQAAPALEAAIDPQAETGISSIPEKSLDLEQKRRAAVAAVAFAIAAQKSGGNGRKSPAPAAAPSVWQAVNRARQLSNQTYAPRKKVVQ
jgi:Na+-transporting methylmalonyl-CoA/oxaloacetate decarboxylase gamma subunit